MNVVRVGLYHCIIYIHTGCHQTTAHIYTYIHGVTEINKAIKRTIKTKIVIVNVVRVGLHHCIIQTYIQGVTKLQYTW